MLDIDAHIFIKGKEFILRDSFFSTNVSSHDGDKCKKCGKENLGRRERVDCDFWGDDIESWCLECWSKYE